jgi:hypothetical protein
MVERVDELSPYDVGRTTFYASTADPRIGYCLFVPAHRRPEAGCLVVVHGTDRIAHWYRDAFAPIGEATGAIVVAPLFPAGLTAPWELESYKLLSPDFRSDVVLLGVLDEVSERYGVDVSRFALHGFSGGGHFAHRFFYLHPERLHAVSIGAPGLVTLLGDERPWWVGTGDMRERFGRDLEVSAMRQVNVQMVVGATDVDTWEITIERSNELWAPGCNDAGRTRIERLAALRDSFAREGIDVRYEVVPGVAHDDAGIHSAVEAFLVERIRARTAQSPSEAERPPSSEPSVSSRT